MLAKKNKKEKVKVYPSIIKVMGSTRYTRFPPRLIIDALRRTCHMRKIQNGV